MKSRLLFILFSIIEHKTYCRIVKDFIVQEVCGEIQAMLGVVKQRQRAGIEFTIYVQLMEK